MPGAAGAWGRGGEVDQRIKSSSYKMSRFWGSNIQHGDYSEQYCIIYLEVAERVDLTCSHHTQKSVTTWAYGCVN